MSDIKLPASNSLLTQLGRLLYNNGLHTLIKDQLCDTGYIQQPVAEELRHLLDRVVEHRTGWTTEVPESGDLVSHDGTNCGIWSRDVWVYSPNNADPKNEACCSDFEYGTPHWHTMDHSGGMQLEDVTDDIYHRIDLPSLEDDSER